MKKRKIISLVVLILVLSITINKLNINKVNNKVEETKQSTKVNKKQFAMYIKENGVYKEYTNSDKFPEEYVIDKNMSKCYDAEDQEIDGVTFTGNSNNITVISGKTAYCYLYFDEPILAGKQILDNLPANSGLSASTLGDMRRYQGSSVKNYICINDTGTKCNSGSNEMYRIIGIVDSGTDEGQIKVIKETIYGNYAWNTKHQASQCSGTICSWPNNDLAKTLNNTFLQNLPTKVQEHIVSRQWYYGDISTATANTNANRIYQIETGQINTTYLDVTTGSTLSNQKWQKTSETLKIGMIYLHDYYWQSTITNCHYDSSNYWLCNDNGWMNISKNGGSSADHEWTMSRVGRYSSSDTYIYAWSVFADGDANSESSLEESFLIRPVFYLSSDVKFKEGGTGEKTNPYILDLS